MSLYHDDPSRRALLVEGWRFADRYESIQRTRGDLEDAQPKPIAPLPVKDLWPAYFAWADWLERMRERDLKEDRASLQ